MILLNWFNCLLKYKYIHYDLLMMSQKEAPRKHPGSTQEAPMGTSWVLPRKVAEMGASYYVLAAAEGSTQEAPIITY